MGPRAPEEMRSLIWKDRGKKRVHTASRRKRFFSLAREARIFAWAALTELVSGYLDMGMGPVNGFSQRTCFPAFKADLTLS